MVHPATPIDLNVCLIGGREAFKRRAPHPPTGQQKEPCSTVPHSRSRSMCRDAAASRQRHSEGAYLVGRVPSVRFARFLLEACLSVALVQAQSIGPCEESVGVAPLTLGDSTSVFPSSPTGMPLPDVAAMDTTIGQGLTEPAMLIPLTYLLARRLWDVELKAAAAASIPPTPPA